MVIYLELIKVRISSNIFFIRITEANVFNIFLIHIKKCYCIFILCYNFILHYEKEKVQSRA